MAVSPGRYSNGAYYIVAGAEVNITCTVTSSDRTSSDLVISHGNYETIILNSTSISCVIPHINESMNFACCVDHCLGPTEPSFSGSHQSSVNIEAGNLPAYENFSCHAFVDENLTCTWYADRSIWTMQYGIFDNTPKKNASLCRNVMCQSSCELSVDSQYICRTGTLLSLPYHILLTGHNDYGVTEYNVSVERSMFATYRRLSSASVQSVGPTWMIIVWHQPRGQARVKDVYTPSYKVTVTAGGNVSGIITNQTHARLSMLHPYTNYTICLEARPISAMHGITNAVWSRAVTLHQRTMESKPSHPPMVSPAGYSWSSDSQLTVYWKAIPHENRNGDIVRYRVHIDNDTDASHVPGGVYSYTWNNVNAAIGHVVTVAGGTKQNLSDPSQVVIHPANTDLPRVDYAIAEKISPFSYNVTWITSQKYVDYVTVTWCSGNDTFSVNSFGWTTYANTTKQVTVQIQGHASVGIWLGVSLTFRNLTHGIMWNKCIFDVDEENQSPIPDVTTTTDAVRVEWGHIFCDKEVMKSRPLFYVVIYTLKPPHMPCVCDQGPNITVAAHFNTSGIIIDNLQISKTYCICVRIRTKRGLGLPSSPVITRLQSRDGNTLSTTIKVLLGVSIVPILVFLILSIKWLCRRYKQASYPIDSTLWKGLPLQRQGSIHQPNSPSWSPDALPTPASDVGVGENMLHPSHEGGIGPKCDNIPVGKHRSSIEGRKSQPSHREEESISDRVYVSISSTPAAKVGYKPSSNHHEGRGRRGLGLKPTSSATEGEQTQYPRHTRDLGSSSSRVRERSSRDDEDVPVAGIRPNNTDYVLVSTSQETNLVRGVEQQKTGKKDSEIHVEYIAIPGRWSE
ncbi:uncharacterized protein LOC124115393 [Haliotis rufescens]|uniref:uncharacterized protein LOC124115393 n=1 Tax=Haliotis rufescens TaxID=6454 RepID=UPI00201F5766|nr:uncharacterized protein LOC124115393 [Haliotis rufescens]